ncbi:O-antigen ligase family protein [Myceligenerans crystallogenes]|uniref:O-antigen ligase-related domain-containing protein n=1 Tax=Myceligenerans crystallogenes TaxID=316335 RepID=A0ABN2NG85_9MICO
MATAELSPGQPRPHGPVIVVLLCLAALLFEATSDVLPDAPIFGVVTWQRVVTTAGFAAALVAGARWRHFRTRLDIPVVVLLLASAVAAYRWGGDAPFRHLFSYVSVYYLATALMRLQPTAWRALVVLAAGAVTVASAVAIGQSSENVPTGFCRSGLLRDASCSEPGVFARATGTFSNPNLLAAFLLLLVPLAVLAVTMFTDHLQRVVAMAAIVLACAALLVTYSRGPWVAGFAAALVLAWQWARTRFSPQQLRLAAMIGAGLLVVGLIGIALVSQAGRSLGVRNEAWSTALRVAADEPLGVGLGRAGDVVNARIEGSVEFFHLHNLWLNWLVEAGVLGFLAITAVTIGSTVTAFGLAVRGHAMGFAASSALIGYFTMNLMDHPSSLGRLATAMWLVLGFVMGAAPARWRGWTERYDLPVAAAADPYGGSGAWPASSAELALSTASSGVRAVPRHVRSFEPARTGGRTRVRR